MLWLTLALAAVSSWQPQAGWRLLPGSGLAWDSWNGIGLAATLFLVFCCWIGPAARAGYRIHSLRIHIGISWLVMLGVLLHAIGILLTNAVAIEYLKWQAPYYMHAGNAGFVLMLLLSLFGVRRIRRQLHRNFNTFRAWHRGLSAVLLLLAGWHIVGSGFLAGAGHGVATAWIEAAAGRQWPGTEYWRGWAFTLLLLLTTVLWWRNPDRRRSLRNRPTGRASATLGLLGLLFTLIFTGFSWAYTSALNAGRNAPMDLEVPPMTTSPGTTARPTTEFALAWNPFTTPFSTTQGELLPVTFAHADHIDHNCVACHHNFADTTGQGFCYDCHKTDAEIAPAMQAMFHGLCRDCHVQLAHDTEPHGPVRACQQCHVADLRP